MSKSLSILPIRAAMPSSYDAFRSKRDAYLKILHETEHFVAVAKPPHTICQDQDKTSIQEFMRKKLPHLFVKREEPFHRPKSVHRLDKLVTGCLLFGRSVHGTRVLAKQFRERLVKKGYLALLAKYEGEASPLESMDSGRVLYNTSTTIWHVLARLQSRPDGPVTYLCWLRPREGKHHQLRLHTAFHLNAPVLFEDDRVVKRDLEQFRQPEYMQRIRGEGIALHCARMTFSMGLDTQTVTCEPPDFGVWQRVAHEYGIDWRDVIEQGQFWQYAEPASSSSVAQEDKNKNIHRENKHELDRLAMDNGPSV